MELTTIREKIHSLIDTTDSEDKLLEIYQLLEGGDGDADEYEYTDEFKAELDAEYEDYQKNKDNVISKEEFYLFTEQLLQRHKNNVL
jgi:hypothetical protein